MTRWYRSRLRAFGLGVVACLGGSLVVVPVTARAQETPATAGLGPPATAGLRAQPAPPDRIEVVPGRNGRSAFEFRPGSGDRKAPYSFVSEGGNLHVRQLGGNARPAVHAATATTGRAANRTGAGTAATTGTADGRPEAAGTTASKPAAGKAAAAGTAARKPAAGKAGAARGTYAITLTVVSDNWTAFNKTMALWNRDTWTYLDVTNPMESRNATANLPPGNYYAATMYGIYGVDSYLLTKAFTVTDKAQTVLLEEKLAKEVAITVDDPTARRDASAVWMSLPGGRMVGFAGGYGERTYVSTASVAGTTLRVHQLMTKAGSSALKPSPYRYDLVKSWPHPLPASPVAAVTTASLAKTTTGIRAQGNTTNGAYQTAPAFDEDGVYLSTPIRIPATVTEYVTPGVTMYRSVYYGVGGQTLDPPTRALAAGVSEAETVGVGPLAPTRRRYDDDSGRSFTSMDILENMTLGDAAGSKGADTLTATSMTLSSGGRVLKTVAGTGMSVTVPQDEQAYRLEQTSTRRVAWSQLSTTIRSEWAFVSGGTPFFTLLPLMDLAMAASGVDEHNRAGAAPVSLAITPSTRQTSAASAVDKVEWSVDDGTTWAEAPVSRSGTGFEVSLDVPPTAAFVSLRVTASNDQGGSLRRTVIRALAGPATGGDESAGGTRISNLKVNEGRPLVFGTEGGGDVTATFTATDPSGIASAGLHLWHGDYNTPDGVVVARTYCTPVDATTSNCAAYLSIPDVRYSLASDALAGMWRVAASAVAKDGVGFTDRHEAGTVIFQQALKLSLKAAPNPVAKGQPITVTGLLSRADWDDWRYVPAQSRGPARAVAVQFAKPDTYDWKTVKTVQADLLGRLTTTVTAASDGVYRLSYAAGTASEPWTSNGVYVDVR